MITFEMLILRLAKAYLSTVGLIIALIIIGGLLYELPLINAIYGGIRIGAILGSAISLTLMIIIPMQNYAFYGTWYSTEKR